MEKLRIYYAHPVSLYNTPQARRDIETLKLLGFDVLNPSNEETEKEYQEYKKSVGDGKAFEYFLWKVDACDAIAFRSFIDGKIGSGVAKEVAFAEQQGKPVIELPTIRKDRILDLEETRNYLKLLGNR